MTAIHWKYGINGSFDTASDWRIGTVPGPNDNVFIDARGTYTVTSSSDETIVSLSTAAGVTLDIVSGSFAVGSGNSGYPPYVPNIPFTGLTGACVNNGTILVRSDSGLSIADPFTNNGTIEAFGDGRFHYPNWGEVALDPWGNSTNKGTIEAAGGGISLVLADGPPALGPTTFTNYGTMEATAQGALGIFSEHGFDNNLPVFTNAGHLYANGGLIQIDSAVIGGGDAVISNDGIIEIQYAGFGVNTSFSPGSNGTLRIDFGSYVPFNSPGHAASFTGTLSGFTTGDRIDLPGLQADA